MKLLLSVFIGLLMTEGALAQVYEKKVYRASCNYAHPLSTYEGCHPGSNAGQYAMDCAYNDALLACENDDNVTCVEIGAKLESVMSNDFIGYKYCRANVIVHGFGPVGYKK